MSQPVGRLKVVTRRLVPRVDSHIRETGIHTAFHIRGKHEAKGTNLVLMMFIRRLPSHQFPISEVHGFQDQLREVQATMVNGKFLAEDSTTPAGQHVATDLLSRCLLWSDIVLSRYVSRSKVFCFESVVTCAYRQGKIDERFKPIYDKLCDIRNQLEKLSITQAWSLRETDLYGYQRQLDRIDESRINGNFEDASGYRADLHAQRVYLTASERCVVG